MSIPIVSIITRTRNRPVLLARALNSVTSQEDPPDWEWIVVNDGGNPGEVESVLEKAMTIAGERIRLLHLEDSKGMEHASNEGCRIARGRYLAIHDDDDSWRPAFLAKMTAWLERPHRADYAGVVCHCSRVEESMTSGKIQFHRETPFNYHLTRLDPWTLLEQNPYPPISFLFRRQVYEETGPFDESLPVLGDWEFNIRVILRHPIGLLAEDLARYHHRIGPTESAQANSISASDHLHQQWEQALRERWEQLPPVPGLAHFGALSRMAACSFRNRQSISRLLSLPIRPGPQV